MQIVDERKSQLERKFFTFAMNPLCKTYGGSRLTISITNMSKTFENNAQKALDMASGIKKHIAEVAHLGIKTEGLDKLEAEAKKAIEMIKEVDALRLEASEKLQKANEQLADVKELAMGYRQTIKNNFPIEKWEYFGIMDKR